MEFDNDRPVNRTNRIEILYWTVLAVMNPLVNCLSFFLHDVKIWWFLFAVNLFLLPAYILYSVTVVPKFLFEKKYTRFFALTILFLATIQLLLFGIYSLIWDFSSSAEQSYFTYGAGTIIRESLWSIIYTLIVIGTYFVKKSFDEKNTILKLEKDNNDFRIKYLRSQLNPHFLFNTLNSIYALTIEKSDKAPEVVVKLADLMRYLIYDCNEDKVPLAKEIEFIQNYMEIEKLRHNAEVLFSVNGSTEGIMIEPFLFIAFVENGFKHAFDNAYAKAFIYITINIKPDQIELSVVNNTSADLETQAKKIQGTGLKNSKGILELLYPSSHALNIIQTEKTSQETNELRLRNAKRRLESLYPDTHTLNVILNNNTFTVSLILKNDLLDKMHNS
jgi:sensor histidine kinase YesM